MRDHRVESKFADFLWYQYFPHSYPVALQTMRTIESWVYLLVYDWPTEHSHSSTRNRLWRGTKTIIKMMNTDSISDAIINDDLRNFILIKYCSLIIYTWVCFLQFPFIDLEMKSCVDKCWILCILISPDSWSLTCERVHPAFLSVK